MHSCKDCEADFRRVVRAMEGAGYGEWKRQWWRVQSGHRFIGEEVYDLGKHRTWSNATAVGNSGCGLNWLSERHAMYRNDCDFHARRGVVRTRAG